MFFFNGEVCQVTRHWKRDTSGVHHCTWFLFFFSKLTKTHNMVNRGRPGKHSYPKIGCAFETMAFSGLKKKMRGLNVADHTMSPTSSNKKY